ncbi:MAG: T3SS (YopN, CesT) and YbjN peptide-binding chaperone 1 [Candidatus Kapaibacterium sp.]
MIDNKTLQKNVEGSIETPQELIDRTIASVEDILKKKFPEYLAFDNFTFVIQRGSTQVMIIVRPFTENETVVECTANVVYGATIDEKLLKFLMRKNAELHFGSFGLLFDNTISFNHSLAGTNLDENELITALNAVAIIADHYDDEIVSMAGGKRAQDVTTDLEVE